MPTRKTITGAIGAVIVGGLMLSASPAYAVTHPGSTPSGVASPFGCQTNNYYSFNGISGVNVDEVRPAHAVPGQTVSIQVTENTTVTGTVGGQVSGDVNIIVAQAQIQVNSSLALSKTSGITYTFTYTNHTSSGQWFHVGAKEDHMNWEFGHLNFSCGYVRVRSGTTQLPYQMNYTWLTAG